MPKKPSSETLSRGWTLYLFANGALKAAPKGDPRLLDQGGLPAGSVASEEQVHQFQASFCKLSREDNRTYFLPWPQRPRGTAEEETAYFENASKVNWAIAPPAGTPDEVLRYELECSKALQAAMVFINEWYGLQVNDVKGRELWAPFMRYRQTIDDPTLALAMPPKPGG